MARRPSSPKKLDRVREREPRTVRDLPDGMRPREQVERSGVDRVPDAVLLAVILRAGVTGCNVVRVAETILQEYGSLTALSRATMDELRALPGIGPVKAQVLAATLELARRLVAETVGPGVAIRQPGDVAALLQTEARSLDREVFWVLLLDAKNRLKAPPARISQGLLDASLVHPREVFRSAIQANCATVVLAHNHPSGDPAPSAEDLRITRQIVDAGRVVDIRVVDHIILGQPRENDRAGFVSLREAGLVSFAT